MSDVLSKILWRSYIFIIIVSLLLLVVGSYFLWKTIINEAKTELTYANRVVSNSMNSLFHKNEALFKITGERLLELGIFTQTDQSINLINELFANNPELAGIGIANPEGEFIITTSNVDTESLPSLLEKEVTSDSFKRALKSNSLVMGRTYFLKGIDEWIVPVRYRIVNKKGEVVAVLAAGLKLKGKYSPWQSDNIQNDLFISIINSEFYFQFSSSLKSDEQFEGYSQAISHDYLDIFKKHLLEQTGNTVEDFFAGKNEVVTLIYPSILGENLIAAFSYDLKYRLFTFTAKKLSSLYHKLYIPLGWLLIMLLGFNYILYRLFKHQSKLQKQSKEDLEFQAQHDQLTGLPNLRYLGNNFEQWRNNNGESFTIIFIDLDDFKNSNDLHGHSVGDKILCKVSSRIKTFFSKCLCIRQGGDEFIVITPHFFDDNSISVYHEFLDKLKQPILIDELEFSVRASIGITRSPADGSDIESLLRKADIAMYEAKRMKCGVNVFSKELDIRNARIAMIDKELNNALKRNEMSLVYQPQIDYQSKKVIGVEALLRWDNKTLGNVPPDEFIPIAESTGVILDIGVFVFETALEEFQLVCEEILECSQNNEKNKILRLSINISVRQLSDAGFLDMLFPLVKKYTCRYTKLMLEITETLTIEKIEKISLILDKIQRSGIEISLDDFGTGYSSLSHLSKLPINELKIDKSFIQGVPVIKQDVLLIKSIINLGKSLDIKVLAEGVENIEQVNTLNKHGCKYFQGFYFSHPLEKKALLNFLRNEKKLNQM